MERMIARPDLAPDADLSRAEMEALQHDVAEAAIFEDDADGFADGKDDRTDPPLVAGVDQAFLDDRAISAIVVLQGESVHERVAAESPLEIPYIPGLLSFREGSPILDAFEQLSAAPDFVLFDGSGRIHFRQAGIATHMGVVLDRPSVGVAKRLLCGEPRGSLENLQTGSRVPIEADSRVDAPAGTHLGYAVQTKQYESSSRWINPLYVSAGHRVSSETASNLVIETCAGYKLPEPIRLADAYVGEVKRELG